MEDVVASDFKCHTCDHASHVRSTCSFIGSCWSKTWTSLCWDVNSLFFPHGEYVHPLG